MCLLLQCLLLILLGFIRSLHVLYIPLSTGNTSHHMFFKHMSFYQLWYTLSKTLAEEAAWKLARENGTDMVTVNPGWVIGPLLRPTLNLSVEKVLKLLKGTLQQLMRISFLCLSFLEYHYMLYFNIESTVSTNYSCCFECYQYSQMKLINDVSQGFHSSAQKDYICILIYAVLSFNLKNLFSQPFYVVSSGHYQFCHQDTGRFAYEIR